MADSLLDKALVASFEVEKDIKRRELVQDIRNADEITQKNITFMLRKDVFGTGPRNAAELAQAIEVLYGRRYATKVSDDRWTPPFEWLHAMYFDTYPQLLGVAPRGSGKAAHVKTPIRTVGGWKELGQIVVGDWVYDENGNPIEVVYASDVMFDHVCYKVRFSNGDCIVADAEHIWTLCNVGETYDTTTERLFDKAHTHLPGAYGKHIQITQIEQCESVPVVCIAVDNPTHLFLLGKSNIPTHNTEGASIITHFKCHHKPNYECTHLGARLDQAQVAQRYLANFQNDDVLNEGMTSLGIKKARWANGSMWNIAAGTMAGVSGNHGSMLSIDELEFLDEQTLEQTWAIPMDKYGYRRFWTGFSTRQRASSLMATLTQQAESGEKNIKLMQWSVFEVMQPCKTCLCIKGDRVVSEPEKACPLWSVCHGELARKVDGWMTREAVVNLMETMSKDSFDTQMLCLRPSSHGLVLSNFIAQYPTTLDRNKGNYFLWEYQKDLPLYCWHDPADGAKSAMCFVQIFQGKCFLFDELIMEDGPTIQKVKVALADHCRKKGYNYPNYIVLDPHRKEVYGKVWEEGNVLGEGGDRAYRVDYPEMKDTGFADIEPGLELVRSLICNGIGNRVFYVNPVQAPGFAKAIANNRYKLDKTNIIYQGSKQELKYKDEIDTIRYGLIHATQRLGLTQGRRVGVHF